MYLVKFEHTKSEISKTKLNETCFAVWQPVASICNDNIPDVPRGWSSAMLQQRVWKRPSRADQKTRKKQISQMKINIGASCSRPRRGLEALQDAHCELKQFHGETTKPTNLTILEGVCFFLFFFVESCSSMLLLLFFQERIQDKSR